jgi:hypothetical protein
MAGNRQQSRFLALVSNYDLLKQTTEDAYNSEDQGLLQMLKTMDSLDTKINQFTTSFQQFYTSSGIEQLIKYFVDFGTDLVNYLNGLPKLFDKIPIAALSTLMNIAAVAKNLLLKILATANAQLSKYNKELVQQAEEQGRKEEEAKIRGAKQARQNAKNGTSNQNSENLNKQTANYSKVASALTGIGAALQVSSGIIARGNTQIAQAIGGTGNIIAGAGQMLAGGIAGKIMGAISIFSGLITIAEGLYESVEEKIDRLKDNVDKTKNELVQSKDEYKTLTQYKKKYEELAKSQYDSVEAKQEFLDIQQEIAAKYPELISGMDSEGNYLVNLTEGYNALAKAKHAAYLSDFIKNSSAEIEALSDSDYILEQLGGVSYDFVSSGFLSGIPEEQLRRILSYYNGSDSLQKSDYGTTIMSELFGENSLDNVRFEVKKNPRARSGSTYVPKETAQEAYQALQEAPTIKEAEEKIAEIFNTSVDNIKINEGFYGEINKLKASSDYIGEGKAVDNYMKTAIPEIRDLQMTLSGIEEDSVVYLAGLDESLAKSWKDYSKKYLEDNPDKTLSDAWTSFSWMEVPSEIEEYYNENIFKGLTDKQKDDLDQIYSNLSSYSNTHLEKGDLQLEEEVKKIVGDNEDVVNFIVSQWKEETVKARNLFIDNYNQKKTRAVDPADVENITGSIAPYLLSSVTEQVNYAVRNEEKNPEQAQQALHALFSLYNDDIIPLGAEAERIAATADLTSLTGISQFFKDLEEAGFDTSGIDLTNWKETLSVNLPTEWRSFETSITSNLKDLEDSLKDVSSGMNLEDAISMVQKVGLSLNDDFLLKDGKYFLKGESISKVRDAYVEQYQELYGQIEEEQQKQIEAIKSFQGDWTDLPNDNELKYLYNAYYKEWEKTNTEEDFSSYVIKQLEAAQEEANTIANEYADYQVKVLMLVNGQIKLVLTELFGEGSASIEKVISAIKTKDFSNLTSTELEAISPYLSTIQDNFIDFTVDTLSTIADSLDSKDLVQATDVNKDYLNKLVDDGVLNKVSDDWYQVVDGISEKMFADAVYAADLTVKETNEILAKSHDYFDKSDQQDALKDVEFYSEQLAYASWDTIRALSDSLEVEMSDLADMSNQDKYGNYRLKLDEAGVSSLLMNIKNGPEIIAENTISKLDEINKWLEDGIGGKLNLSDKSSLTDNLGKLGIEIDPNAFTQTVDGFKLAQSEAYRVLTTLQSINSLAGKVMLSSLVESAMDSDERLNDIFYVMRRIDELNKEINNAEPGSARRKELEGELAVCKEITAELKKADGTFNFMNRDLPSGYDDPLSAWEGIGDAFKVLDGDDFKQNRIGYQDFYNMITMMGDDVLSAAGITSEKMNGAANLLDAGAQALVNVDGETFVDLSKLGANFNLGATNMKEGLTKGIHVLAQNQINMLDAEIAMLETVVKTQEVFDSVAGEDKKLSIDELMPEITTENGEDITKWTESQLTLLNALLGQFGDIEIAGKKLSEIIKDPASFVALTEEDKQKWVNYIQQFYSDGWLADSSGKLALNGVEIPIPTLSFPSDGKEKFQSELKTLLEGQDLITPEEYSSLIAEFFKSLEKDGKKEFTISDFIQFAKGKGASDEFVKWLTENTGIIINEVGGFKKEIKDSTGETVELQWNFEYGTYVSDSGKVYNEDGTETTLEEIKSNKLHDLNEELSGKGQTPITIEEIEVGLKDFVFKVSGSSETFSSYEDALDFAIAQAQSKTGEVDSETTATETDIEIVPQKIYIKEDSSALGEDGSLLITDPIAKATATVVELEIDPTGAKAGMKQAQGAANTPIEIEITDEITGKASTLTITPSTTPTLELGEETPTVSDVSATAESATVKPTSYQVDLTDSEGNTQSVTVDGTANLETVISGLTKDENGNYSIDSVNGIAQVSAEVSQADTSIQTLWDKWSNKEITFTVKPQEEGSGSNNSKFSSTVKEELADKKLVKAYDGSGVRAVLVNYHDEIMSTISAIQQMVDLGQPVSQEDIQTIRDLQTALTTEGTTSLGGANYPTVEALGELADKCVQLNNVSPTVLATANTLSTMDLAQTATYLADMVTNAESLIELEFTNFADLETATETAKTTVDSIATKLAEMTGRTITINVVEQQNGEGGEGGNSTYTTTYSFNTDNLTSAVTSIQNASNNATTAIEKVASAMDEIPTDSSKAKAVSDTGKSIKNLPDKKTVRVVISQPKTTSINAVATLTVKVQGEGSVVSGIFEKKFSAPVGGNIDMSRAKGNIALAKGTKTLMGELGPELVVSNGHYFVAGENGAEFVNLADDAIVFNHLQTKKLLQNGSAGRGMAITNEKKATSMATGNAMASASDALAELKRIRAMWQALLDSSASDLGKKAGSGGGGGGGGGGKGDDPKAITHDLERWYNLLRQIAKAEQQITLEQAKRKNMQSGYNYSDSLEKELGTLKKQEQAYRQLASLQEDWYNIRRKELLDTDFSKVFTYDKDGLMQYVDGVDMGLDILAKLNSTDKTGAPTGAGADSQAQINYLKSIGFDVEKYLRTNDDGTKAENTDDMMQNFWDRVDGWKDELDGLYDEYNDHLKDIEENISNQNAILQEYIDNQLSVEEKLMTAITDRQQAEIDKMQDLLDATQNASEEYLNGLTDALNKEQQLYNKNQNDRELSKLQRQLAILQRSGGSASEIKNLQNQIDSKLQSDYFDAMQKQIDTIQEASDNQIEKLQKQIDVATEALEYQKENGLLWQEVYQMMNEWTPEKMLEFIEKYTQSYREDSGLQSSENSKETKKELEIWANKRDMNARDEAWKKYYSDAKYDDATKKSYSASAQEAFNAGYASGGAEEGARRANEIFENAKKNQGSSTGGNTGGSSTGSNTTPTQTEGTSRGKVKTNTGAGLYIRSKPDLNAKKVGKIPNGGTMEIYDDYKNSKWYKVRYNGTTGYSYKQYIKKYAQGGLVDYTGPAWVDGSKSKPEAFLSAKDTALLKSKIFSDSNFSLRSCIEAIQALADNFRSISTDNSENINIENISIQVGNGTISSDYSARKAGQEIMDEILNVAKKAGNLTLARR